MTTTYPSIAIITFITAILGFSADVSVPLAVASIQFLNMLRYSARWLPFFIGLCAEFLVSMSRIQEFLLSEEINPAIIDHDLFSEDDSIQLSSGNFSWGFELNDKKSESSPISGNSKVGDSLVVKTNGKKFNNENLESGPSETTKHLVNS